MKKLMYLMMVCCIVGLAQAGILLDTNFDGADLAVLGDGVTTLTNVSWTGDQAAGASTTLESFTAAELHNGLIGNGSGTDWLDNVGVNANLITGAELGIVASFTATASQDLGELVVGHSHLNGNGFLQVFASNLNITLTNTTDGIDLFTDTTFMDYSNDGLGYAWRTTAYDLSGVSLEAGKDYTLTMTRDGFVGGGGLPGWNQIQLSEVPEPATMVLLGLGSLLLRRKR